MKLKRRTLKNSHVDAWGSMTVPMGTYDVLRVHESRDFIDSIWAKVPFFGWQLFSVEESTEERYIWWSDDPEVGYILVNLNVDPETGDVTSSEFMAEPHLVGRPEQKLVSQIRVYPNPVQTNAYLLNTTKTELHYTLFDLSGKKLLGGISSPEEKTLINLNEFESGIYFIRMKNGDGVVTEKLVKK
ncbi:MAG: T9SS type A sorting domain-containing protein [Bacteroidota bacterium]|nr:T9SS type A sorting domain-containing protein [Bacteroidota bacterium]